MRIASIVMSVGCLMRVCGSTILAFILLASSSAAFAVKMDETTHDMVIQRLEMGIDGMSKSEPERNGIVLRLADLYADRARLKAMNEIESACKTCTGSTTDRKKAISLYEEGLPKADKADQGRFVLQIAHLYTLNDDTEKSNKLYQQILKAPAKTYSSEVRALAFTNVGEIKFRNGDFKGALKDFTSARNENLHNRALIEYRMAWCELNLGKTQQAIDTLVNLINDPKTLATQTTDGKGVDPTFVQDLTHDLTLFLARAEVGPAQIDLLKKLSPENVRKANLHSLATETDRIGKKQSSLIVWAAYMGEPDIKPSEKLEVQIHVAQLYYDMNRQDIAANAFEKAVDLWSKTTCSEADQCTNIKTQLRRFVVTWNKGQKHDPSPHLLRVYMAYIQAFPADTEMLQWAAIVAKDLKRTKEAAQLFHRASVQAAQDLKTDPKRKESQNIYEASLLTEIEMAEASKDPKSKEAAYDYYLKVNPNGKQAFEVRYQRAHVYYDSNRFQDAFSEFHYLASQPSNDHRDLRLKSADLALDSLVALKDDKNLQVRSLEYARLFSERKAEYLKISRKATMNLVAGNLKSDTSSDKSKYKADLVALNNVDMTGADDSEKIKFDKNKIAVAEKAVDLDVVKITSNKLLDVKSLNADDREWTKAQLVWAVELELNFALAYHISSEMKLADMSKADRELRLALLADLADLPTLQHNLNYLRLTPGSSRSANLVRVTLVKNSPNPWRELEHQLKYLKSSPDLLAGLTLEVFAAHKDYAKGEQILRTTKINHYAAGQTLQRHLNLKTFVAFDHKIRSHRILGYSDKAMQKSLKERLQLLSDSEKRTQTAFRQHDWTLQALGLAQLSRENRRLYHDILALPMPKHLNAQEKARYQKLLNAQSEPYLARAQKIDTELSEMWSKSNSVQNLQAAYMTATPDLQKLYRDEIIPLAQNAPSGAKNRLQGLLNTPYRRPSQRDILMARREAKSNPLDIAKVERLRDLESQDCHPAMVVYLDERIAQLKKGKTL